MDSNVIEKRYDDKLTLTQQDQLDLLEDFHGQTVYSVAFLACATAAKKMLEDEGRDELDAIEFATTMLERAVTTFGELAGDPDLLGEAMKIGTDTDD